MKLNIFKKIITLSYLIIFLFGFFVPLNQSFAQTPIRPTISFQGGPRIDTEGRYDVSIAVNKNGYVGSVTFTSSATPSSFTLGGCGNSNGEGCVAVYSSILPGPFTITATLTNSEGAITSNSITKTVKPVTPTSPPVNTDTTYTPLAPLPGLGQEPFDTDPHCQRDANGNIIPGTCTNPCPFGNYLNIMIKLILGIAAVLAMIMITMGGIEYMTSELVSGKEAGKETITHAILGLLIALGAYLILNTINPQLLSACLDKLPVATIEIGGESSDPFVAISPTGSKSLQTVGINCPKSGGKPAVLDIGKQFIGKTIYSQAAGKRNTVSPPNVILDCSAFVAQVYNCAGLSYPGGNSNEMFSTNATAVSGASYDFSQLHTGDLVGWKPSDDPKNNGHVAIYLGNGKILDTQPGGTAIRDLSSIKNRIKYVKWSN